VAGEPEPVAGLEVVAWRGLAVSGCAAGEEVRADVGDARLRRDERRDGVEEAGEE